MCEKYKKCMFLVNVEINIFNHINHTRVATTHKTTECPHSRGELIDASRGLHIYFQTTKCIQTGRPYRLSVAQKNRLGLT